MAALMHREQTGDRGYRRGKMLEVIQRQQNGPVTQVQAQRLGKR